MESTSLNPKLLKWVERRLWMAHPWDFNKRVATLLNLCTNTFNVIDLLKKTRMKPILKDKGTNQLNPWDPLYWTWWSHGPSMLRKELAQIMCTNYTNYMKHLRLWHSLAVGYGSIGIGIFWSSIGLSYLPHPRSVPCDVFAICRLVEDHLVTGTIWDHLGPLPSFTFAHLCAATAPFEAFPIAVPPRRVCGCAHQCHGSGANLDQSETRNPRKKGKAIFTCD